MTGRTGKDWAEALPKPNPAVEPAKTISAWRRLSIVSSDGIPGRMP